MGQVKGKDALRRGHLQSGVKSARSLMGEYRVLHRLRHPSSGLPLCGLSRSHAFPVNSTSLGGASHRFASNSPNLSHFCSSNLIFGLVLYRGDGRSWSCKSIKAGYHNILGFRYEVPISGQIHLWPNSHLSTFLRDYCLFYSQAGFMETVKGYKELLFPMCYCLSHTISYLSNLKSSFRAFFR